MFGVAVRWTVCFKESWSEREKRGKQTKQKFNKYKNDLAVKNLTLFVLGAIINIIKLLGEGL